MKLWTEVHHVVRGKGSIRRPCRAEAHDGRLGRQAKRPELREKLFDIAGEWMRSRDGWEGCAEDYGPRVTGRGGTPS